MAESVDIKDKPITIKQFRSMTAAYAQDLKSLYTILDDEIQKTLRIAAREGWTTEKLFIEIDALMD